MMIAEREQAQTDVVRAGVSDEELARIVALAGFAPVARGEKSSLAADDHPVVVAARIASSAATLRLIALLTATIVLGGVAALLV